MFYSIVNDLIVFDLLTQIAFGVAGRTPALETPLRVEALSVTVATVSPFVTLVHICRATKNKNNKQEKRTVTSKSWTHKEREREREQIARLVDATKLLYHYLDIRRLAAYRSAESGSPNGRCTRTSRACCGTRSWRCIRAALWRIRRRPARTGRRGSPDDTSTVQEPHNGRHSHTDARKWLFFWWWQNGTKLRLWKMEICINWLINELRWQSNPSPWNPGRQRHWYPSGLLLQVARVGWHAWVPAAHSSCSTQV